MKAHHKITPFIFHDKTATGGQGMRRNANMRINPSGGKHTLVLLLIKSFTCAEKFYKNLPAKCDMWLNFSARDKAPIKEMLWEYNKSLFLQSNKL